MDNWLAWYVGPGVPYEGDILNNTYFTQELGKVTKWARPSSILFSSHTAPNVAVMNVMVERTSPTTMDVSWRPLTLFEARGFVTFYSIAYTPTPNSRRQQASQDTMYMNASADSDSVTIEGLDGDLTYSVTVSAGTRAGIGVESDAVIVEAMPVSSGKRE